MLIMCEVLQPKYNDLNVKVLIISGGDTSLLQLYFENSVSKVIEIPKYSVFTVLVDIGSALGLWLGLSALDLLAGLVDGTQNIIGSKICCNQKN